MVCDLDIVLCDLNIVMISWAAFCKSPPACFGIWTLWFVIWTLWWSIGQLFANCLQPVLNIVEHGCTFNAVLINLENFDWWECYQGETVGRLHPAAVRKHLKQGGQALLQLGHCLLQRVQALASKESQKGWTEQASFPFNKCSDHLARLRTSAASLLKVWVFHLRSLWCRSRFGLWLLCCLLWDS